MTLGEPTDVRPSVDDAITLRDGRRLAYAEWGDAEGRPAVFFHGTPGSRLLFPGLLARDAGPLRLVTVDRPGYGGSDPLPTRTVLEFADDVAQLVDALGLERFAVVGWSGGGSHALACAWRLADRVERAAVISGRADHHALPAAHADLPDRERELVDLGLRDFESYAEQFESQSRWLLERRDRPESFLAVERPPADARIAQQPPVARAAMVWLPEAARRGLAGYAADWLAVRRPWGFDPGDVGVETTVWHGDADRDVPVTHAEFVASRLPKARLTVWPGEGHWGILPHWREIASALVG